MLFVLIAGVLAIHGEEPSREEKFRGALAQVEVRGSAAPSLTSEQELRALAAKRPTLVGSGVALGVGVTLTAIGGLLVALPFLSRSFAISLGESGVFFMIAAGGLVALGAVIGIVAGVVMSKLGVEQTRIDARIRELQAQPPSATEQFSIPPHVVLARF
jgi:hypothetical protein